MDCSITNPKVKNTLLLLARLLLGTLFIYTGYSKLIDVSGVAGFVQMAEWQIIVSGLVELAGGLLIVLGLCVHSGALLLFLYLIVLQVMIHLPLTDDVNNTVQFLKNLSVMGGLLLLMLCGGGQYQLWKCKCGQKK